MITDIILFNIFLNKEIYEKYFPYINRNSVTKQGEVLLDDIAEYFSTHPDIGVISITEFIFWFHSCRHPDMSKENRLIYDEYFFKKLTEIEQYSINDIIEYYEKRAVFDKIEKIIEDNGSLEQVESLCKVKKIVNFKDLYLPMGLNDILTEPDRKSGLNWRLNILNKKLGGIIIGDFIVVAAQPGIGKTAFLSSELSYIASQLPFGKRVFWFNNEGADHIVRNRIFQATLNKTYYEIRENYIQSMEEYCNIMGGDLNKIQVIRAADQSYKLIDRIINEEKNNIGFIVIDMLDKIKGFSSYNNKETVDEKHDRAYEWASNLAIRFAPVISTSQTSYTDNLEYLRYPPIELLKGSRISKQGSAQIMIMIGKDKLEETTKIVPRFISSPKNKVGIEFKSVVQLDKDRMRYIENESNCGV